MQKILEKYTRLVRQFGCLFFSQQVFKHDSNVLDPNMQTQLTHPIFSHQVGNETHLVGCYGKGDSKTGA